MQELRNKSTKQLHEILEAKRAGLEEATLKLHTGDNKQVATIRSLKKDIAQTLTALNEQKEKDA